MAASLPLPIAVPTTTGTGSETTLAAVITDADTHHKYAINDFNLIPDYAVLEAYGTAAHKKLEQMYHLVQEVNEHDRNRNSEHPGKAA